MKRKKKFLRSHFLENLLIFSAFFFSSIEQPSCSAGEGKCSGKWIILTIQPPPPPNVDLRRPVYCLDTLVQCAYKIASLQHHKYNLENPHSPAVVRLGQDIGSLAPPSQHLVGCAFTRPFAIMRRCYKLLIGNIHLAACLKLKRSSCLAFTGKLLLQLRTNPFGLGWYLKIDTTSVAPSTWAFLENV